MNTARMTLDTVPAEWMATFEQAETTEQWDQIIRICERLSPATYAEALRRCAGRDSRSKRRQEARERARDLLDSI